MKKSLIFLVCVVIGLLSLSSCDRFDNPAEVSSNELAGFSEFQTAITNANEDGLSGIMFYFSDDYLNFGKTKEMTSSVIEDFLALAGDGEKEFTLLKQSGNKVKWQISSGDHSLMLYDVWSDGKFVGNKLGTIDQMNGFVTAFLSSMNSDAVTVGSDNYLTFVQKYFSSNFKHDGYIYSEVINAIKNHVALDNASISTSFTDVNTRFNEWDYSTTADVTISYKISDDIISEKKFKETTIDFNSGNVKIYGNQGGLPNNVKPLAEINTATWCGSCANVEIELHHYIEANPNAFYLEYHSLDAISFEHIWFDNFYSFDTSSLPHTAFQGNTLIDGYVQGNVETTMDFFANQEAEIRISNLNCTLNDNNSYEVEFTTESENFNSENVIVRYAVYEQESSVYNSYNPDFPCFNVVLKDGLVGNLEVNDANDPTTFTIEKGANWPDDLGIIVIIQRAGSTWNSISKVLTWEKKEF